MYWGAAVEPGRGATGRAGRHPWVASGVCPHPWRGRIPADPVTTTGLPKGLPASGTNRGSACDQLADDLAELVHGNRQVAFLREQLRLGIRQACPPTSGRGQRAPSDPGRPARPAEFLDSPQRGGSHSLNNLSGKQLEPAMFRRLPGLRWHLDSLEHLSIRPKDVRDLKPAALLAPALSHPLSNEVSRRLDYLLGRWFCHRAAQPAEHQVDVLVKLLRREPCVPGRIDRLTLCQRIKEGSEFLLGRRKR